MGNPNLAEEGKKYQMKPGETLNPNGRPPKVLTNIMRDLVKQGYVSVKPANVVEAYETLLSVDEEKLKEIINDKSQPMLVRIVGRAMMSKKGFEMLERMLDRVHGKPKQVTETQTELKVTNDYSELPLEDRKKIREILERNQSG